MKKTIVILLSLAGLTMGRDITIDPFTSNTYGSWEKLQGNIDAATDTYGVGENDPNWVVFTSVYTLEETCILRQDEVMTFSYAIENRGSGNSVVTVALVGSAKAIVTGHGTYNNPATQIQAGQTDTLVSLDTVDGITGYMFAHNNNSHVAEVTAGATLNNALPTGQKSTISGSIAWIGSSYTLELTSSALASGKLTYDLGADPISLSQIALTFDGGKDSNGGNDWKTPVVSNLSVSIIPEPAPATLSLLALVSLAARRRRQ